MFALSNSHEYGLNQKHLCDQMQARKIELQNRSPTISLSLELKFLLLPVLHFHSNLNSLGLV